MVRITRLYGQPTGYYMKIVYKSLFPTSNVNSECIFGFYTKFYVGICLVRFLSFIFFADAAATKKLHRKNGTFFLIILAHTKKENQKNSWQAGTNNKNKDFL